MTQRIEVGFTDRSFGTIAATADGGFAYTGREALLRGITGRFQEWYPHLTPVQVLDLVISSYRGQSWARVVPEEEGTPDAPR